jgi:hypothetical protein
MAASTCHEPSRPDPELGRRVHRRRVRQPARDGPDDVRRVVGVDVVQQLRADQLLGAPPEQALDRRALVVDRPVRGDHGDDVGGVLGQRAKLGLGLLALGDVGARSDEPGEAAVGGAVGHRGVLHPPVLPVPAPQAVLEPDGPPGPVRRHVGIAHRLPILRVDAVEPPEPPLLLERPPREVEPRLVEEGAGGIRAGRPDQGGHGIGQAAEVAPPRVEIPARRRGGW